MTAPAHSKPVRLATAALQAAIARDWRRATDAVDRLNKECGGDGLWTALVAWCDTFAFHAHGGKPDFGKVRLVGWDVNTGALGEPPARTRWALELIQARAGGDLEEFQAVVKRLHDIEDGFERGRYVSALLESIATSINTLPRGYARMGRSS